MMPTGAARHRRATAARAWRGRAARPGVRMAILSAMARSRPMSAAGKASGSRSCAHRDVLRRPLADPAAGPQRARSPPRGRSAPKRCGIGGGRGGDSRQRRGARARHPERRRDPRRPDASGVGKGVGQIVAVRLGADARRRPRPACRPGLRAAATVICWPSTARTASSKPSQAPGTRRPGRARTSGASAGSVARCAVDRAPGRRRGRTPGAPGR